MAKNFNSELCTVYVKDGFQRVMLPDGRDIPHLLETVVVDNPNHCEVVFKVLCNNASTKEEALAFYNKIKK